MLRLNVKQLVKQQKPPLNESCCKLIASVSTYCCSKQARRVPPRLCKVEHLPVVHDSRWLNCWKEIRNSKFCRKWKRRCWTHAGLWLYKHVTQPNHKSAPANCLQRCVCSSPHTHTDPSFIIIFVCHVILFYFAPVRYTLVSCFCLCEDTNRHNQPVKLKPELFTVDSLQARKQDRTAALLESAAIQQSFLLRIDVQMSPSVTESN